MKHILYNDKFEVIGGKQYLDGVGGYDGTNPDECNDIATVLPNMVEITHDKLKSLRDNSNLVPGQQYRIIDYITTTTQANTISAGHQFDIIVTADTEDALNEIARACLHEGDTYFSENGAKLEAWQIWYCLDNDTERFAWACDFSALRALSSETDFTYIYVRRPDLDTSDKYAWTMNVDGEDAELSSIGIIWGDFYDDEIIYTSTEQPPIGAQLDGVNGSESGEVIDFINSVGKGVIYRMIDEWNNDCPYDFKNIKFKNPLDTDDLNYYYTFNRCTSNGHEDMTVILVDTYYGGWTFYYPKRQVTNNLILTAFDAENAKIHILNFIIFIEKVDFYNESDDYSVDKIVESFYNNKFSINCVNMIFENSSYDNTFGCGCNTNRFDELCYNNTFGDNCYYNTFGSGCADNTFGSECYGNTFGYNCRNNTFGYNCYINKFGDGYSHNTFGHYCHENTFGNSCYKNTFGNDCCWNTFTYNCRNNTFGNNCRNNTFGASFQYNIFVNECCDNTFGSECYGNTFGYNCRNNTFGNNCRNNTFGSDCHNNTFGNTYKTGGNYYKNFILGDSTKYVIFASTVATNVYVQNYKTAQGLQGTYDNKIIVSLERNLSYEMKIAKNSKREVKIYCEADLIA